VVNGHWNDNLFALTHCPSVSGIPGSVCSSAASSMVSLDQDLARRLSMDKSALNPFAASHSALKSLD
jgi:hypothetical protein